jgi:thiol:disulfide interchange protein DsbD
VIARSPRAIGVLSSLAAALALAPSPMHAQVPRVATSLIPEVVTLQPGGTFRVAVRLQVPEGWHIYWKNPGLGGLPTTLTWELPPDITAGPVEYPYPERADTASVVSHIYRGEVFLVTPFTVRASASVQTVDLRATITWGICREICIAQRVQLTTSLPIQRPTTPAQPSPRWPAVAASTQGRFPTMPPDIRVEATHSAEGIHLRIVRAGSYATRSPAMVTFFPESGTVIPLSVAVPVRSERGALTLTLPRPRDDALRPHRLTGVLVSETGWGGQLNPKALAVDVEM